MRSRKSLDTVYYTFGLGREAGMLKLPADVDLGNSDGGGARKERESGGDCLDSSDAPSLSIQEIQ